MVKRTLTHVLNSNPSGTKEDIQEALNSMNIDNPQSGIKCMFFDYTYHTQHSDIVLKLSKNQRNLLIMSEKIAQSLKQRSKISGCCGTMK